MIIDPGLTTEDCIYFLCYDVIFIFNSIQCVIESLPVVGVKGAVVKNAILTQKLGIDKEPKLIFYRNGDPILYEGRHFILLLLMLLI